LFQISGNIDSFISILKYINREYAYLVPRVIYVVNLKTLL
jgi:hypothetical protein